MSEKVKLPKEVSKWKSHKGLKCNSCEKEFVEHQVVKFYRHLTFCSTPCLWEYIDEVVELMEIHFLEEDDAE